MERREKKMDVSEDIAKLVEVIKKIGTKVEGGTTTTFGALFDATADILESLVGTLKAAKKRKILDFPGEMLLKGVHDKAVIKLFE